MILYSNVKEYAELKLGIPFGFLKFHMTEEGTYKHFISFNSLLFDYFCFGVLTGIYQIIQHKLKEKRK
ncbi:hypothetical protein [Flavobacterium sp.]|uniref:hypothetical protein n=1 Tax=Flavobacterium sp. TaxID=239 RepID=UPI003D14C67D